MTPNQALALLTNVEKDEPAKRQAALNTVTKQTPVWAIQLLAQSNKKIAALTADITEMKKIIVAIVKATGVAMPAPEVAAAPADPTAPANGAQPASADVEEAIRARAAAGPTPGRVDMNGEPMDPRQAAIEDMMDAATEGLPPNQNAPSAPSASTNGF
jgi:hypothetical protein